MPRAALLVAGQFVSTDLERAVAPLLAAPGVCACRICRRANSGWRPRAVDACINLRYPAAGESSGIAVRLMGIGKPVMLTDGAGCARVSRKTPASASPPAARSATRCWHHMILLTSMAEVARTIGQRGAGHIAAHHRVEQIGKRYWDLLCECCI